MFRPEHIPPFIVLSLLLLSIKRDSLSLIGYQNVHSGHFSGEDNLHEYFSVFASFFLDMT